MAIKVNCACGKESMAKDEMAGKKVRCPQCKATADIPSGTVAFKPVKPSLAVKPLSTAMVSAAASVSGI